MDKEEASIPEIGNGELSGSIYNSARPWSKEELELWNTISVAMKPVMDETKKAMEEHPPFNSAHEAYAIMQEESEEMWDAIKHDDIEQARKECIQTAAMCLRFLIDVKLRPLIP